MNEHERDLYRRLVAFAFDEPGTPLTFAARLARENGWSRAYADRVIEEYKKFAFLAMVAGHPVCPSEDVDEAWHLHLTYTESYWRDFCKLLGRPLHHHPTKGGAAELEKHVTWYEQTLGSYGRFFEHDPPETIWPPSAERFHLGRGHRRVDLNNHWVIPKPRLKHVGAVFMAAGPAAAMTFNPFDFDGPTFLVLYSILFVLAVLGAFLLRQILRASDIVSTSDSLDPYEAAYLAGGKRLAIRAALGSLVDRGALAVRKVEKKILKLFPAVTEYRLETQQPPDESSPELEQVILLAAAGDGQTIPKLHETADAPAGRLANRLECEGLLLDDNQSAQARYWPALLVAGLAVFGTIKIVVGVYRDRPVGFLLLAVIVTFIVAAVFLKRTLRSRAGDQLLNELRRKHSGLNVAAHDMPATDLILATALFGTVVLNGGPLDELRAALAAPTKQGGGASGCGGHFGSGCGGGGCGGGGCGGGGCGGGGCGGCS